MDPVTLALAKRLAPITVFRGTGDAQIITNASMTSGSAVLTTPDSVFAAADVGKEIIVGGFASAARLKSTIASYQSATQVTLADTAPATVEAKGAVWGTDNGPAFQAAIDTMAAGGVSARLIVPAGKFLITTPVVKNFADLSNSIIVEGLGSASQIIPATGSGQHAIRFQNARRVEWRDITMHGTPDTLFDALTALRFEGVGKAIVSADFYGVSSGNSGGAVVEAAAAADLLVRESTFRGCTGNSGINVPVVRGGTDWIGVKVVDSEFIDHGTLDGVPHSKTPLAGAAAWVQVDSNQSLTDAYEQSVFRVQDCRFDEGAVWSVRVFHGGAGGRKVDQVHISGIRANASKLVNGGGVYVQHTSELVFEESWVGYNTTIANSILKTGAGVGTVKMRNVRSGGLCNIIDASATTDYIEIEDCVYETFTNAATASRVITHGVATVTP